MKKYFLISATIFLIVSCSKNDNNQAAPTPTPPAANLPNVVIGSQVWTINNLDVTTYRNGEAIPQVTDPVQWAALTTGAWCYYNNDPANNASYGKLYNWYAVNDSRGLAPTGWHVPSSTELHFLATFLGGNSIAGGKMKAVSALWQIPNTGATNSCGFTGLPGGYRNFNGNGQFYDIGNTGLWWSSTTYIPAQAYYRFLNFNLSDLSEAAVDKANGFSVRCIKD